MQIQNISLCVLITLLISFMPVSQGLTAFWASPTAQVITHEEANRLFQQGVEQYQAKQLQLAIQYWQQSLTAYRTLKDHTALANTLKNLSVVYLILPDYPKAIAHLQQYLTITRKVGDRQGEEDALETLANTYAKSGSYAKAIKHYQQYLTIIRQQSNSSQDLPRQRKEEGVVLGNLATAYRVIGNYNAAIEFNRKALRIFRELKDRHREGEVLRNLGNAYENVGDYNNAIASYEESIKIARQFEDTMGEAIALNNLGAVYANEANYDKAIATYEQSLQISKTLGDRLKQASTLINLGSTYHSRHEVDKARSYYQQALELASSAGDRKLQGEALGSLAIVYEDLRDYPKAIKYQQQSLAIAQSIGDPTAQGIALNNFGHALFSASKLAEAEEKLRTAIKLLDNLRPGLSDTYKVSIFDTQVHTYNLLQQILVAANKPQAALEIAEQGRARAFAELLARRIYEEDNGHSVSSITSSPKTDLSPNIEKIRQIAREQNATLVEYAIVTDDDFKFRGKQRGREQKLFIWVVQLTGKVAFRSVDLKSLWQKENSSLENLVTNSRESIGVKSRGIFSVEQVVNQVNQKQLLQQLHELLISPIADLLPSNPNARVIFIPQESLFLVPFPALQDKDGKYLIEKHTVLTAPSIQVLSLTRTLKEKRREREAGGNSSIIRLQLSALVVGNPLMPKVSNKPGQPLEQLPQLPNAEQEALDIAKLLNTTAIVRAQATKVNILKKMPTAKLVHLATHGLLEYGSHNGVASVDGLGVPGAIALTPSGNDDGLLTASEIINLRLQAELVVLSACRTGEGRISSDGVIGLSRSFISAGTESVIVSLWSVPDVETAKLMKFFYQTLQKNPDKASALRQAMLMTMKDKPLPLHWAAFTLIGES
jgi:CHAT domain-containing protein/Flp pilus assembly protein TadD